MKKWISRIIDIILVIIIAFLGYVVVSMMVSKDKNYGIPKAFGLSFLYVATDSMEDPENDNSLDPGCGIIIKSVDPSEINPSTPIYDETGEHIIDYQKDGDIVTFYYKFREDLSFPDTHRVISKRFNEETQKYEFQTMGDNPTAHQGFKIESWDEDVLIGKVIYHSMAFGSFLAISSPTAAASAGKNAWFFPVAIITPIALIAIISIIESFVKYHKENKEREANLLIAMEKAGIDLNDERAVELFRMKEEIRLDIKEEMEKEKEKARQAYLKELKKQKKNNERK